MPATQQLPTETVRLLREWQLPQGGDHKPLWNILGASRALIAQVVKVYDWRVVRGAVDEFALGIRHQQRNTLGEPFFHLNCQSLVVVIPKEAIIAKYVV